MTDNNPTEAPPPAGSDEAQQDVAQASVAKAEAAGTASDELSEDDLEAVAGGGWLRLWQRGWGHSPLNLPGFDVSLGGLIMRPSFLPRQAPFYLQCSPPWRQMGAAVLICTEN